MDATTNQVGDITKTQDGRITKVKEDGRITKAQRDGMDRGDYDMFADYVVGDTIRHPSYGSGIVDGGMKESSGVTFTPVTPSSPQIGGASIGGQGKFAHIYIKLDDQNFTPLPNPAHPGTLRLVCNVDKAVVNSLGWHTNLIKSERRAEITKA